MLFGKGDTSKLTEAEKRTLAQLRRLVETGHIMAMEAEQSETVIRAVSFFRRFEAVFEIGKSIRNTGLLVGGLLAMWWVAQDGLAAFVRNAVGSN
jgi:hypothetical protein